MINLIYVIAGGAIGAALRYTVGMALTPSTPATFPFATLAVNLAGGFAMGVLAVLLARGFASEAVRLFVGVGLLGGFTTFSAFSLETFAMIERGDFAQAAIYAAVSVVGSVLLLGGGMMVGHNLGLRT